MQGQEQLSRRTLLKRVSFLAGAGIISLTFAGCGGADEQAARVLEIACDGNNMAFDPTSLTAPAGQVVQVNFNNVSTIFEHNWVLVAGGADVADQVNQAATGAGPDLDYIPADQSQILAHTKLTPRGETGTITFTTPTEAGEYVYLCTFPGHYLAGMRGTLLVTA
jgi:azurin